MMTALEDSYILGLEKEKAELQRRVDELRRNISTIDTLIIKRKSQLSAGVDGKKVTRKNSEKLYFEQLILQIISASKNGLRTASLYKELNKRGLKINYNTLRSYVVQLRDSGKIKKNKHFTYNWVTASVGD